MTLGRVFALSLLVAILCLLGFATLAGELTFGALPSLDARLGGYTTEEARSYFRWLEAEGLRETYLDVFFWIDMVFPLAVLGVLATAIAALWARPVPMVSVLGTVVAVGYAAFDYMENVTLRALIAEGAEAAAERGIAQASLMTQMKWSAIFAAVLLIAAGLVLTALKGGAREEGS